MATRATVEGNKEDGGVADVMASVKPLLPCLIAFLLACLIACLLVSLLECLIACLLLIIYNIYIHKYNTFGE